VYGPPQSNIAALCEACFLNITPKPIVGYVLLHHGIKVSTAPVYAIGCAHYRTDQGPLNLAMHQSHKIYNEFQQTQESIVPVERQPSSRPARQTRSDRLLARQSLVEPSSEHSLVEQRSNGRPNPTSNTTMDGGVGGGDYGHGVPVKRPTSSRPTQSSSRLSPQLSSSQPMDNGKRGVGGRAVSRQEGGGNERIIDGQLRRRRQITAQPRGTSTMVPVK